MPIYEVYNLGEIGKSLKRSRETRALGGRVHQLKSLYSIKADVINVAENLQTLLEIIDSRGDEPYRLSRQEGVVDRSLAMYSVIVYSRCFKNNSSTGNTLDISLKLPAELRGAHERVTRLRSQALAHFGGGEDPGGSWARDDLYLLIDADTGERTLDPFYERAHYRGALLSELYALVPAALEIILHEISDLERIVLDGLNSLGAEGAALLAKHFVSRQSHRMTSDASNNWWLPLGDE